MAKKEEQVEVVEPEVVEETKTGAVVTAKSSALEVYARGQFKKSSEAEMAKEVSSLYKAVFDSAVKRALHFGSVFYAVEFELGSRGKLKTGRGNADEGMNGWLAKNCPEVNYFTAMRWKELATVQANRLCDEGVSPSDAILMLQGRDDELGKKAPKKAIELRDAIYSAPSINKLTQGWFDFGDKPPKAKGGRPKAEDKPLPKLKKSDEAKAIWNVLLQQVTKTSVKDAIPLLPEKETQIAYDTVRDLADMLKMHLAEFSK